jgi:hypothetical protein
MKDFISTILFLIAIASIGFAAGVEVASTYYEKEAVKKGFAEYGSTTGKWRWKEMRHDTNE